MNIQEIIDMFQRAIGSVDDIYYSRQGWNESMLNYHKIEENDSRRKIIEPYLATYDERVFCYELYHKMRVELDKELDRCIKDGNIIPPVFFQAELKKRYIGELVEKALGIQKLDKQYMPDFLLHCPSDVEHQELIVEVKTNPKLKFPEISKDLLKIEEFIRKYKYEKGIFLTVNTDPDEMQQILTENRNWFQESLPNKSKIIFICKRNKKTPIWTRNLENFFSK